MKRLFAALAVAAVASGGLAAAPVVATYTAAPSHARPVDTQMDGASGSRVNKPVGRYSVRPRHSLGRSIKRRW